MWFFCDFIIDRQLKAPDQSALTMCVCNINNKSSSATVHSAARLLHKGVHAIHWNPEWPVNLLTSVELTRNARKILVRGVNAPLPPEAKKILKI